MDELQEFLARVERRIAEGELPTDRLYCVIERSPDDLPLTTSISSRAAGALRLLVHGYEPNQETFNKQWQEWERYSRRCWANGQMVGAIQRLAIVYDEWSRTVDERKPVSIAVFNETIGQLGLTTGWPLTEAQKRELARSQERELARQRSRRPAGQPDLIAINAMYNEAFNKVYGRGGFAMPTHW